MAISAHDSMETIRRVLEIGFARALLDGALELRPGGSAGSWSENIVEGILEVSEAYESTKTRVFPKRSA